jgi:hypothetical protein
MEYADGIYQRCREGNSADTLASAAYSPFPSYSDNKTDEIFLALRSRLRSASRD